jgi:hypothetical protein
LCLTRAQAVRHFASRFKSRERPLQALYHRAWR